MRVAFVAPFDFADVRFIRGMHVRMLFPVARVGKAAIAAGELTFERLLAGVSSFVNLQVLRPSKEFSTPGKRTRERFLPSVDSYVVYQLVFGLERLPASPALLPIADVEVGIVDTHMLVRDVRH